MKNLQSSLFSFFIFSLSSSFSQNTLAACEKEKNDFLDADSKCKAFYQSSNLETECSFFSILSFFKHMPPALSIQTASSNACKKRDQRKKKFLECEQKYLSQEQENLTQLSLSSFENKQPPQDQIQQFAQKTKKTRFKVRFKENEIEKQINKTLEKVHDHLSLTSSSISSTLKQEIDEIQNLNKKIMLLTRNRAHPITLYFLYDFVQNTAYSLLDLTSTLKSRSKYEELSQSEVLKKVYHHPKFIRTLSHHLLSIFKKRCQTECTNCRGLMQQISGAIYQFNVMSLHKTEPEMDIALGQLGTDFILALRAAEDLPEARLILEEISEILEHSQANQALGHQLYQEMNHHE